MTVCAVTIALICIRASILPDIIPLLSSDNSFLMHENENFPSDEGSSGDATIGLENLSDCILPTNLEVTLLDCNSHSYYFTVDNSNGILCVGKWYVDGVPITSGLEFTVNLTPGTHEVCLIDVICCATGESANVCETVFVPENCECIYPEAIAVSVIDCLGHKYHFDLIGGQNYCTTLWYDGGILIGSGTPLDVVLTPGVHSICVKVYCCVTNIGDGLCIDVVVPESCCELPTQIEAVVLDCESHKYEFTVPNPDGAFCFGKWYVDGNGVTSGVNTYSTNLTPGVHEICVNVECCETGEGIALCITVVVPENCDCVVPTAILTTILDCESHKYNFSFADGSGDLCVVFWLVDNDVQASTDNNISVTLTPGTHTICLKVVCCNGSGSNYICTDVFVPENCECQYPEAVIATQVDCDSHKYQFTFAGGNGFCVSYWRIDNGPEIEQGSYNPILALTPGWHTICAKVECCNGGPEAELRCVDLFVPEICECINPTDIVTTIIDCPSHKYQFDLSGGQNYCDTRWYLDGFLVQISANFVTTLTPGTHTICSKWSCCDDPSMGGSLCIDVVVPETCGCQIPTSIDYVLNDCQTNEYTFTLQGGAGAFYVMFWTIDGTPLVVNDPAITITLSAGPHTICAKSFCFEENDGGWVCVDLVVPEPCGCIWPGQIETVLLDCEGHKYEFTIPNADGSLCIGKWFIDSVGVNTGANPFSTILTPGSHTICVEVKCCETGEAISICTTVVVPENCDCVVPTAILTTILDCESHKYNFSFADGSGDLCVVFWLVDNDVQASTDNNISITLTPGTHTICLKVFCCNGSGSNYICTTIIVPENCICSYPTTVEVQNSNCVDHLYTFGLIGGSNYCIDHWNIDGGADIEAGNYNPTFNLTPGVHEICVKVHCCEGGMESEYVCLTNFVVPENCDCVVPTAILTTILVCESHKYNFSFADGSGDLCVAFWLVDNDVQASTDNNISITLTPGTHTICLKVYCCNGSGSNYICTDVFVPENCECQYPNAVIATQVDCDSHKYQFTFAGGNNFCVSYWRIDNGPEIEQGSYNPVLALTAGWHTICAKVECCNGGLDAELRCVDLFVPEICECINPTAIVTTIIDCPSHKYQFDLSGGQNYCDTRWYLDGALVQISANFVTTLTPGAHTICSKWSCCDNPSMGGSLCIDVLVPENCPCLLPTQITVIELDCPNHKYRFEIVATGSPYCIKQWYIDGQQTFVDNSWIEMVLTPGSHEICVFVYCCDEVLGGIYTCVNVIVPESCFSGMAMAPGNSGIENQLNEKVEAKLFPVPTESILNISYDQLVNLKELTVMNMMGEIIVRKSNLGDISTTQLDVQSLSSGVYTVTLNANGHLQHISFIKK